MTRVSAHKHTRRCLDPASGCPHYTQFPNPPVPRLQSDELAIAAEAWAAIPASARSRLIDDMQLCAAGILPKGSDQRAADAAERLLRAAAQDSGK